MKVAQYFEGMTVRKNARQLRGPAAIAKRSGVALGEPYRLDPKCKANYYVKVRWDGSSFIEAVALCCLEEVKESKSIAS
jgi:hypothetical protein